MPRNCADVQVFKHSTDPPEFAERVYADVLTAEAGR